MTKSSRCSTKTTRQETIFMELNQTTHNTHHSIRTIKDTLRMSIKQVTKQALMATTMKWFQKTSNKQRMSYTFWHSWQLITPLTRYKSNYVICISHQIWEASTLSKKFYLLLLRLTNQRDSMVHLSESIIYPLLRSTV